MIKKGKELHEVKHKEKRKAEIGARKSAKWKAKMKAKEMEENERQARNEAVTGVEKERDIERESQGRMEKGKESWCRKREIGEKIGRYWGQFREFRPCKSSIIQLGDGGNDREFEERRKMGAG
ncbi:unnamed protein product [Blepharisma stoltei]|uniref:Uncharacterized protein n=1 Tax=Blepharisma stoltei TaxID=1481888 RepID=A0AAU9JIN9_9CILI|nr:unnamed protein product [Blepharisma stoltei]